MPWGVMNTVLSKSGECIGIWLYSKNASMNNWILCSTIASAISQYVVVESYLLEDFIQINEVNINPLLSSFIW